MVRAPRPGLLVLNDSVVPMMCPTINSYKRLLGGEVSKAIANGTLERHVTDMPGDVGSRHRIIRL